MRWITAWLALWMLASTALAQSIPEQLQPWRDWVLHEQPQLKCPAEYNRFANKRCAWPSELRLTVNESGAQFEQRWVIYSDSWVKLPGNHKLWPQRVSVNGKPHPIAQFENAPAARLSAGEYTIRGDLRWAKRPQSLPIPADSGLVSLTLDNKTVAIPNIEKGHLWLSQQASQQLPETQGDALSVNVFRRLTDTVPFTITTQLHIKVSGRDRELQLGRLLLPGMTVQSLGSPLPARIEDDGRIRLQARAGDWRIQLISRAGVTPQQFSPEALDENWPKQEVWSFDAQRHLRGVEWRGGIAGDPSQMNVPGAWAQLPAYWVSNTDTITLEERYRGDANPTPNQLTLQRNFWLDFSGDGFTIRDRLQGELHRADRLSMTDGYQLGRLSVNGQPQLITALDNHSAGVEVAAGQVDIEAVSRFDRDDQLPGAVGWQQDISQVKGQLHLPPGWKLLHSRGIDRVDSSWLTRWSLWDLFLCLVIAGAAARVLGLPWGVLGGITLALTYQESSAPVVLWVNVILALGLLQAIPDSRFSKLLRYYQVASLLALTIVVLNFSVDQIRKGIYPQLERNTAIVQDYASSRIQAYNEAEEMMLMEQAQEQAMTKRELKSRQKMADGMPATAPVKQLPKHDPGARIQTGPGEPQWQWHKVHLHWSGPVLAEQTVDFFLLPPAVTRLWRLLSVLLVAAWLVGLIKHSLSFGGGISSRWASPAAALILAPLLITGTPDTHAEVDASSTPYPPQHLLEELKARLSEAPKCMPQCASVSTVKVVADPQQLQIDLTLDILSPVQLPLPSGNWWQTRVSLNGAPANALSRDTRGQLMVALPKGRHWVRLQGLLNGDRASVTFPLKVHNVETSSEAWQVSGVQGSTIPSGTLQLDRKVTSEQQTQDSQQTSLLPNPVAPFVRVNRHLVLGLEWTLTTTVERIAPARGAINMDIPLLPGESVLSSGIKVIDGKAQVSMAGNARRVRWSSTLTPSDKVDFNAPQHSRWVEQWQLGHSAIWHVQTSGINPIKASTASEPRWQPWPGEQLTLQVQRPAAVDGPNQTVERLIVNHRPGAHSSDTELTLQVRASLGGNYPLTLPAGAQLQSVTIDGKPQVLQLENRQIQLLMHPGSVEAVVNWRAPQDGRTLMETPALTLPSDSSNIDLRLQLPRDRWPLFVAGPDIGPAMLFWGILIVILIVSITLGWGVKRFGLDIPVRAYQWVLLGLGVSTVSVVGGVMIVIWFAAFSARKRISDTLDWRLFNLTQVSLIVLTLVALGSLVATIPFSLLSTPDMQVVGNHSSNFYYNWYQDHSGEALPQGWVFSLPMWVYRGVMLAWSLWLMLALLNWVKWGWSCFSQDSLWKQNSKIAKLTD